MPKTYEPIASTTVNASTSTLTFNSFSGYTDLRLVMFYTANTGAAGASIIFNGDTGTNYSTKWIKATSTGASTGNSTGAPYIQVGWQGYATPSIPNLNIVDIFSYSNSTFKTVIVSESADISSGGVSLKNVSLWRSTAAITSITINENAGGGNWAAGSMFTLYGIKAA